MISPFTGYSTLNLSKQKVVDAQHSYTAYNNIGQVYYYFTLIYYYFFFYYFMVLHNIY